ncbi:unnamed protein product [Cylindrotheca closterium]|uniref:PDZ domain-containing protein n=1 Tax=Cylindrotheca closterium TaxID=2856 RepID=A0AAD2CI61_9STRA|nr:unnamed protein product [Cylindrotheca closterium]
MTILAVAGVPSISLRPGISFACASKSSSLLTISAVAKDGVFGRSPLVPGVVVLTINGQEATWMDPKDAQNLVKSGDSISITVEAFIAKIVRKTRLEKLGIVLKESKGEKGLLIAEVAQDSPFANTDLKPGMKIVNINGTRCPNRPKEAIRLMQKIFGTLKVVAVQTNREKATEKDQDAEVAMNWTLSIDSAGSKREAEAKRKVELKRKLSKQGDKFSNGLDKLESSLIRLESSVKGSSSIVRSRTEISETPLEPHVMNRSISEIVQKNQATESKEETAENQISEGYTLRKTGSYICDIDEVGDEAESEKNSSKLFNFQQSPVAAISQLRNLGRKKKQTVVGYDAKNAKNTDTDDATRTDSVSTASKYFNFDQTPSEAMAKLKKLKKKKSKTPTSKGRRKKKKEKSGTSEDVKSPQRPRAVDFAGHIRKVSKKAREKMQSSLASTHQEVSDPDESLATGTNAKDKEPAKSSFMSGDGISKAGVQTRRMSFGRKSEPDDDEVTELSRQLREVQVIQTLDNEMGLEVCIAELPKEGHTSNRDLSVEEFVMISETSDNMMGPSDLDVAEKIAERDTEESIWPGQPVKMYDDTALAFTGLKLADPKRASSPRNAKEAEQSEESSKPASKTVVMNMDDLPEEKHTNNPAVDESNIEQASIEETLSQADSYFSRSDEEYSDEFETDSEYDYDDDDYSGSEGDWSEDSGESVEENDKFEQDHGEMQEGIESRDFGDNESRADHFGGGREESQATDALSMNVSSEAGNKDSEVVTVCITKASRDDVLGFKVFQYEDSDGLFISEIDKSSGLRHSGLKPGMQVTKVNGQKCPNDFSEAVTALKNTIGAVKIEAIAPDDQANPSTKKKDISTALQVPAASSFIESQLSNMFSGVLSAEDGLIVKTC